MLFNSWQYAVFLPFVWAAYWVLPQRHRIWVILAASYVFYGAWDWRFLGLILLSTLVDYSVGRRLSVTTAPKARRRLVVSSVVANLAILGAFKYSGFFVSSAARLLDQIGLESNLPVLSLVLPVGISFYTFQTMSYTIDVYRGHIEPERDLRYFAAYVAFFPQLVAGPIERAARLVPQLRNPPSRPRKSDFTSGMWLISTGLFRKIALADSVAPVVEEFFSNPGAYGFIGATIGVLAFAMQIYGDFAGYTAMARGSARLLGIELVENFHEPYLSRSVTEFWRRWHISLSQWLRDYLYIPLGGNRGSKVAVGRNLLATMFLGGLWHGAGWGFVLWGGLHGIYLMTERPWRNHLERRSASWHIWLIFLLVSLTWIPFRAPDFQTARNALSAFSTISLAVPGPDLSTLALVTIVVTLSFALDLHHDRLRKTMALRPLLAGCIAGSAIVFMIVVSGSEPTPFIYFQF